MFRSIHTKSRSLTLSLTSPLRKGRRGSKVFSSWSGVGIIRWAMWLYCACSHLVPRTAAGEFYNTHPNLCGGETFSNMHGWWFAVERLVVERSGSLAWKTVWCVKLYVDWCYSRGGVDLFSVLFYFSLSVSLKFFFLLFFLFVQLGIRNKLASHQNERLQSR